MMMMKKFVTIILTFVLAFVFGSVTAFAAGEEDLSEFTFPKPKAPNYFVYTDGDAGEGQHDDMRMIMVADPEVAALAAEYDRDSDAFYEKYGIYSFTISMQYDVSLDDEEHWQHNEEWDKEYYNDGIGQGYPYNSIRGKMMEDFEFFWLTYYEGKDSNTFVPYQPAILTDVKKWTDWEEEIYSFDTENHNLYIRCRYYMEWEPYDTEKNEVGEKQSKFSEWSDSAIFGKDSTQIIPEEPTIYEAPVISDLKIILPGEYEENCHLEYAQTTPESVWLTNVYYLMTGDGYFDGLETQISIDDGEWQTYNTADSWGDWCISNETRGAFGDDVVIAEDSHVKLRIRFLGSHGPSEWSNVAEVNGGGTNEVQETEKKPVKEPVSMAEEPEEEKCSLCGFCPVPFGLCILIWLVIIIVVVLIIVLIIVLALKKKKCPACKTIYEKQDKFCPNCGRRLK